MLIYVSRHAQAFALTAFLLLTFTAVQATTLEKAVELALLNSE